MKHVYGKIFKDTKLLGRKEILLEHMKGKVLDIGSGEGELLIKATLLGHDIVGLERSQNEIDVSMFTAQESGVKINVKKGEAERIPYDDETFDTIVMGEVIEHVFKPIDVIKKILKKVKKGGKLVLTTPVGFAHFDPDHKNFFFTQEQVNLMVKMWIFEMLSMNFQVYGSYVVDKLHDYFSPNKVTIEQKEYGDSKHPSLDFLIIIEKQ